MLFNISWDLSTNAFASQSHLYEAGCGVGTALWIPARPAWLGFFVVVIGSDLRARAEEALLEKTFDERYQEYRSRTYRFVPGVY